MNKTLLGRFTHCHFKDFVDHELIESPIEEEFYRVIAKHLGPETMLTNQVWVKTTAGRFRMDFVASVGDKKVAFECDGKDYHNGIDDDARDDAILATGTVGSIIHCRGTDIVYRINDVLAVVASWHPELFSDRGVDNLLHLAHEAIRDGRCFDDDLAYLVYDDGNGTGNFKDGFGRLFIAQKKLIRRFS